MLPLWLEMIQAFDVYIPRIKQRQDILTNQFIDRIIEKYKVIKGSSKAVYLIQNRTKNTFYSWEKFVDMGFTSADIEIVSDEVIRRVPDGAGIP